MKPLTLIIIALGAIVSLGIMLSTTAAPVEGSDLLFTAGIYLWVTAPFIILGLAAVFIYRRSSTQAAKIAILLTAVLVSAMSTWIYCQSIYGSSSSTSALIFIFLPAYSIVATIILFCLAWLPLRFLGPGNKGVNG